MKVLTLHQPWASLVALGVKSIETRSWSTEYRGRLAIHAAAKRTVGEVVGDWRVYDAGLRPGLLAMHRRSMAETVATPLGAIIATATLVDVVPIVDDQPYEVAEDFAMVEWEGSLCHKVGDTIADFTDQLPYGDFTPGRFAWLLTDVEALPEPVPFKGGQGLTRKWTPEHP